MRLLDQLKEKMDEIEEDDDYAFRFIQSIMIQKEEKPDKPLTGKQFKLLCKFHTKYCN